MNSGRIFTELQSGEVNILQLSPPRLKRIIIVLLYTHSVISTTLFVAFFVFSGTASSWIFNISATLIVAKRKFTPAILLCLDHALFTPLGVNNAQLLRDSEPIRLLETPRSLSEYILIIIIVFSKQHVIHCVRLRTTIAV